MSKENEHKMNIWDEIEYELYLIQSDITLTLRKLNKLRNEVKNDENSE